MDATRVRPEPGAAAESGAATLMQRGAARVMAVDLACFRLLASRSLPKAVSLPLILLVRIGDGWIWGALAVYIWWALPFAQLETTLLHCVLSIVISLCFYLPIKFLAKRPRPYDNGMDVTPMVPPLDKYSFPSGHTMNNLAVALTLALHLPRLFVPALLLPPVLGLLRVLFGVHYFSDIVGGTLLGALAFFLSKAIFPAIDL
jgi:undecaprenyl-diphosphatase